VMIVSPYGDQVVPLLLLATVSKDWGGTAAATLAPTGTAEVDGGRFPDRNHARQA
jgi:hypothetical protein